MQCHQVFNFAKATVGSFIWYISIQGIAEAYKKLHPSGSATVTQFQPRPQLLVREQLTHRPTIYNYADAVFSTILPPPTSESLRLVAIAFCQL